MICGLLGQGLGHSYSPAIHALLGDYEYTLIEKEPTQIEEFLHQGNFDGLNVTMPYKKTVLPYLDQQTETAKKLGAVNTIIRRSDHSLLGHNSDYFGFLYMIRRSGLTVAGKKCLVLGSGGASNTAMAVLRELNACPMVISRAGENNYSNLHLNADAQIIVNTTPVGMYPYCGNSPIDLSAFPKLEGVLDVVYNPARTKLLLDAEARGLNTANGLWMLVAQAAESSHYFTGHPISHAKIEEVYEKIRYRMENIVLIGMPGCGKSTIGAALAEHLSRPFVDIDQEIEKAAGKTIPAIFAEDGEAAFRQLETQILRHFGQESGLVIATGGGCVTRKENYDLLHQNGHILWLRRALSTLETKGRPLSIDLHSMYAQRKSLYESFADRCIDNNGTIENTLVQILEEKP